MRMAKTLLSAAFLVTAPAAATSAGAQQTELPVHHVAVVMDGPWERNAEVYGLIRDNVVALAGGEFDVRFDDVNFIVADWTVAGVDAAVGRALDDSAVDIVVTVGAIGSHNVALRAELPKPVIASTVVDATLQGLPLVGGASGKRNLNYLDIPDEIPRDLASLRDIAPFERLAVLVNPLYPQAVTGLQARLREVAALEEAEVRFVPVGPDIAAALSLVEGADAAYILPLFHLPDAGFDALIQGLIDLRVPSFSWTGRREVERGILSTLNPDIFPRLSRRVALHIERILLGDDPAALPVTFTADERLALNMATARAIGVYPSVGVMLEADLVDDDQQTASRTLTLEEAVREGVRANLAIAAEDLAVAAAGRNIALARSAMRPQAEVSSSFVVIDSDRASASFGAQAERTFSGAVGLSQVIFSEPLRANVGIQEHLQGSREAERDVLKLDIALAVAEAYLNVLRAKAVEEIEQENLERTRANLGLARTRERLGQARAGEVFRWDAEVAQSRQRRIAAFAQRRAAEISLNQLLNVPLEETIETPDIDTSDARVALGAVLFERYVQRPDLFRVFRDFMVQEGARFAPEVAAIDRGVSAAERFERSASRSFWSPTIALQTQVAGNFAESGAGQGPPPLPPELAGGLFTPRNETTWDVGFRVSLPLFEGGSRFAEVAQARDERRRLLTQQTWVGQKVEQRIRTTLEFASAAFSIIAEAEAAAQAADRTLTLVLDSYGSGASDIIDLIDAQNAARVTRQLEANAVYDFLTEQMRVRRAIGLDNLHRTPEQQEGFLERIAAFFESAGVQPLILTDTGSGTHE